MASILASENFAIRDSGFRIRTFRNLFKIALAACAILLAIHTLTKIARNPPLHAIFQNATQVWSPISYPEKNPGPVWLIATMSPAHAIQRRAIIRATWQKLYRNDSLFRTRFVISNPGQNWLPVIEAENAAHSDLIILPHLQENHYVANHMKTIEFLKWIVEQGREWQYVSKIDDDCFLEPFAFYEKYLKKLPQETSQKEKPSTIIGRKLEENGVQFPGGQFYTMTWDIVELLVQMYHEHPLTDFVEDVLIGQLLHLAKKDWNLISLENRVAFDYDDRYGQEINGIMTAWAAPDADLDAWEHGIGPGAINPHKMKTDEAYLRVAACYSPDGLLNWGEVVH